jgi:hypothetical protein
MTQTCSGHNKHGKPCKLPADKDEWCAIHHPRARCPAPTPTGRCERYTAGELCTTHLVTAPTPTARWSAPAPVPAPTPAPENPPTTTSTPHTAKPTKSVPRLTISAHPDGKASVTVENLDWEDITRLGHLASGVARAHNAPLEMGQALLYAFASRSTAAHETASPTARP